MPNAQCIDTKYLLATLRRLLEIPSPSGDTRRASLECEAIACELQIPEMKVSWTRKGDLILRIPGARDDHPRGITVHIDTLGAVVSRIYPNGRLQLAQVGSSFWSAYENENVTVETADGSTIRGTVLVRDMSYHGHIDDSTIDGQERSATSLEVRLDALTSSPEETRALGIEVGDYVHFDTRYEESNGFIKTRFLDDKASIACAFAALKAIAESGEPLAQRLTMHFGTYEEVLHGGGTMPNEIEELLAVDVAPVGVALNSSEQSVSLAILDKDGPYDRRFCLKLQKIAKRHDLDVRPAIFPRYSCDAKAFWMTGGDARCALIGPGVHATHAYERTHTKALEQTAQMIAAYLLSEHED